MNPTFRSILFAVTAFLILRPVATQAFGPGSIENEIVRRTNEFRESHGLRPLSIDFRLVRAARGHSDEMLELNYFDHDSPTPGMQRMRDRIRRAGVDYLAAGENIATLSGYPPGSVARVSMEGWIESPGHRRNLLNPQYTHIGVGVAMRGRTAMLTQDFSLPRGAQRSASYEEQY